MRVPLRQKTAAPRAQTSAVQSIPAPVGGWNARDALAEMDPRDAVVLDNWFPNTSYCEIRGGFETHATGTTGNIKTLAVYNKMAGTSEMFAYTASGIYDVTSAGAVGASKLARTDGKHQWVNFGDGTNNWLIAVNGVDKPAYYDGTTWTAVDNATTPALTGLTTTNIIGVFVSKGRLYFIEKNSLSVWYLSAAAAGGALTEFDLSSICKRGGYLVAGATWTVDAGDGPDDRIVFVTSEGEVVVYEGTNPGSAAAWALVGVYEVGSPLGRRCLTKIGGDLSVITENGAFPLSRAIQSNAIDYRQALSFKIENAFTESARLYGSNFGWESIDFPARAAFIVNVPLAEDGTHYQYVMNTITKAWCRFTGWDAETFAILNGALYFADGTATYAAWSDMVDGTSNIVAYGKTAFSYFGRQGLLKKFTLFRPMLAVSDTISFLTDLDVDFRDEAISGTATYSVGAPARWDTATWDNAVWGIDLKVVKEWTSPSQWPGFAASGKLKIATNQVTVQWMACDYVYEYGAIL